MPTSPTLRVAASALAVAVALFGTDAHVPVIAATMGLCILALLVSAHHALTRWVTAPEVSAARAAEADRLAAVITRHATPVR